MLKIDRYTNTILLSPKFSGTSKWLYLLISNQPNHIYTKSRRSLQRYFKETRRPIDNSIRHLTKAGLLKSKRVPQWQHGNKRRRLQYVNKKIYRALVPDWLRAETQKDDPEGSPVSAKKNMNNINRVSENTATTAANMINGKDYSHD